jgi:hypothetical protein
MEAWALQRGGGGRAVASRQGGRRRRCRGISTADTTAVMEKVSRIASAPAREKAVFLLRR